MRPIKRRPTIHNEIWCVAAATFTVLYALFPSKILIAASFYSAGATSRCLLQRSSIVSAADVSWSSSSYHPTLLPIAGAASSSTSSYFSTHHPAVSTIKALFRWEPTSRWRNKHAGSSPVSHLHYANYDDDSIGVINLNNSSFCLEINNFESPSVSDLRSEVGANNVTTTRFISLRKRGLRSEESIHSQLVTNRAASSQLSHSIDYSRRMQSAIRTKIGKESSTRKMHRGRPWTEAEGYAATDVQTLRKIFGTNKNKWWGDLDAETTRILYHTLLPRALIRLHAQGLEPEALAPLAYEARVAAKRYARERCRVPARVMAVIYDGLRHWRKYGKWSSDGLSWDQLWEKYESQIIQEHQQAHCTQFVKTQVSLRILESSCKTSKVVDRIVLRDVNSKKRKSNIAMEVLAVANQLDREIHELLEQQKQQSLPSRARQIFLMRLVIQTRRSTSMSQQ